MEINYRNLNMGEAEAFWEMQNQLDYETKYMLYEPGERKKNVENTKELIRESNEGPDFLCAAMTDQKIVGYLSAQRGTFHKIAHTAYIVVGILKDYQCQGIGTRFFQELNEWANENGVTRQELTVICENDMARHLYEKNGFQIEGVKKQSIYMEGKYFDEYYMAKCKEGRAINDY